MPTEVLRGAAALPHRAPVTSPTSSAPPRRARRRWLLLPFAVVALGFLALCAAWFVLRDRVAAGLDGAEAAAARAGVALSLPDRRIDGFPFRLRVRTGPARVAMRSGWAVEAPALEAQAFTYNPLHWVLWAPRGLTVVRPEGGPVRVEGTALRASASGLRARPWRVVVSGEDLRFTTPAGARPFSLASAGRLALYLKPAEAGAAGDGALRLDVDGARATAGSVAWNLAPEADIEGVLTGRLASLAAFSGPDWGAAVRRWRDAGGALALERVEVRGGPTELWARGGSVAVGPDGMLRGAVPLRLRQAPQMISGPPGAQRIEVQALPAAGREAQGAGFDLMLEGGGVRLGPVPVGPSPKVG